MSRIGSSRKIINPLVDPHMVIVEQPSSSPIRFRYECEGRSAGSIPGANSTAENKTFPTIKILNWTGSVVVVVSCVSHTKPYQPHPNLLVGKDGCKEGISTLKLNVTPENNVFEYQNMGIQCVKKNDAAASLAKREKVNVDPFSTGFGHKDQKIELNAVRLCFQVFLRKTCPKGSITSIPLKPVVSEPIFDKKSKNDLVIVDISEPVGTVDGGIKMMIFCEKLLKEDIAVRFFERRDNKVVWSALADLKPQNVHRQVAMSFKTPPYRDAAKLDQAVKVQIELYRPSDGTTSLPTSYVYLPQCYDISKPQSMKRKKPNVQRNKHFQQILGSNPPTPRVLKAINNASTNNFRGNAQPLNIPLNPPQQMSCQGQISPESNQHVQPQMVHVPLGTICQSSRQNNNQLNIQNNKAPISTVQTMNNLNTYRSTPNQFEPIVTGSSTIVNNNHHVNNVSAPNGFRCHQSQQQANYGNWNQVNNDNQNVFFDNSPCLMTPASGMNGNGCQHQHNNNYANHQVQQNQGQFQQYVQEPWQPIAAQQTHTTYQTNNIQMNQTRTYQNNLNQTDQLYCMSRGTESPNMHVLQPQLIQQQQQPQHQHHHQQLQHQQQLQQQRQPERPVQTNPFAADYEFPLINGPQATMVITNNVKGDLNNLNLNTNEFHSTMGQHNVYAPDSMVDALKPTIEANEEDDLENMTDSFSSLSVKK